MIKTREIDVHDILNALRRRLLYIKYDSILLVRRVERYSAVFNRSVDVVEVVLMGGVVIELDAASLDVVEVYSLNRCSCGGEG
ncbi:MAG: hypothetical protein QXJ56_07015 [Ignisphaera sp.]